MGNDPCLKKSILVAAVFWAPRRDDCSCPVQWRRFCESTVRAHARDLPLVMGRRSEDRAGALAASISAEDQIVQSGPEASPMKWHQAHATWFFETFVLRPFLKEYQPFRCRSLPRTGRSCERRDTPRGWCRSGSSLVGRNDIELSCGCASHNPACIERYEHIVWLTEANRCRPLGRWLRRNWPDARE